MDFLIRKKVAQPIPHEIDWNEAIKLMAWLVSGIIIFFKTCDSYFASKKREKQEFIIGVVKATMDSCLQDIKKDILEIRGDVKHFNETVVKIYTDFK